MATKKTAKPAAAEVAPAIVAYKGFNSDWKCLDFQFAIGETYTHDGPVKACSSGFHACINPLDVLSYYNLCDSKFAEVELTGEVSRHGDDSKIAGAKITIKAELGLPKFIAAGVVYLMSLAKSDDKVQAASGDSSKLAASGNSSQLAASGDYSKLAASGDSSKLAASGNYSKLAASGDYSQLAASGNYSQLAASGNYSQLAASGDSSIAMAAATNCMAKAGELGCIALTRWVESEKRYRVSVAYIGENGIKENTFYRLNAAGEFVEVA